MSKFGENLETDTGSYGQSAGTQKYQVQGKRVRWAAPFLLRLPGIIEVTAATSVEQPEFLVKEQRVWKDRVVPGPVEVSPLNPIRTNSINIENQEAAAFETYPKLPVAPYARQSFIREPVTRIRETVVREPVVREIVRDAYVPPAPRPQTYRYRVVDTRSFKELVQQFESADRDGNGRIDKVEFVRIVDGLGLKGLTTIEIEKAFRSFDTDGNGVVDFNEFFDKFKNEYVQDPFDSIHGALRDAILRSSGNVAVKDRFPVRTITRSVGPAFVRETFDFKDLQRAFERRGPRGRVNFFDFQDIINARTNRVSTSRLKKAFDRMKIPNSDVIFFDEFLNVVGRKTAISRSDDIERYIYDAVLDLNL